MIINHQLLILIQQTMILEIFIVYMMLWLTIHELRGWIELANNIRGEEPMPESVKHMYSEDIIFI